MQIFQRLLQASVVWAWFSPLVLAQEDLGSSFWRGLSSPYNWIQDQYRSDLLWCGYGNRAPSPSALSGVYPNLDKCCRSHDVCPTYVGRGECFKGVCNKSNLFPILACECEMAFINCLESVAFDKRPQSNVLLYPVTLSERVLAFATKTTYFAVFPNLIQRQCVLKTHPVQGCYVNSQGQCRTYQLDRSRPQRWQTFNLENLDHLPKTDTF